MQNIFQGVITALITPFDDGRLDIKSLQKLIEYQVENNIETLVIGGSTGEGFSLSSTEYVELLQAALKVASGRLKIIAGCNFTNTNSALVEIEKYATIGVDGLMITTPSYVRPTQEGLYKYFAKLHDETSLPIMLYTVPVRTGVDFMDDTIIALSALPKVHALKDAGWDLQRPLRLSSKIKNQIFNLLSGNDEVAVSYNAQGGRGCVSVASNIAPKLCKDLQQECLANNFHKALLIQQQLLPLYERIFAEVNPIPVKYAAQYLGLCTGDLRAPLCQANKTTKTNIEAIIDKLMLKKYD